MNLQNNSREMNTIVETFITEETADLIYDNEELSRWNSLVEELGLQGQTKIAAKDKSPIPFMHMKTGLHSVFSTLCPVSVDIEEYNITPIPVQILDLVALSKRENYFHKIQVWYDDRKPDPAVVGITGNWVPRGSGWMWDQKKPNYEDALALCEGNQTPYFDAGTYYLIGKWGDVKHSFDELRAMAIEKFIGEKKNDLNDKIKQAKRDLDDLESEAYKKFN